jgi:aryl-alcohol dehydrogenase-like predicted oxidoreductase
MFGKTGLRVSELCLGAMTFGRETTEEDSGTMMDLFVEAGGNFIDTANVYGLGVSEEIVGRWIADKNRHQLVLASKARFPMGEGPNDAGVSRKALIHEVEQSLRRLGTDYLDLYQVHAWDELTPLEETLSTLDTLVRDGKVRYAGVSNYAGWQLQKALDLSKASGWTSYVSLQAKYNLLVRDLEWELIPVCREEGLALMVWSPLLGGWLSGRYKREMGGPPSNSRVEEAGKQGWSETWEAYGKESTWKVLDVLFAVAEETGRSPAQAALNWLLNRPGVTCPIIGARKIDHLKDNLGSVDFALDETQMKRLNDASEVVKPYPYDFIGGASSRR